MKRTESTFEMTLKAEAYAKKPVKILESISYNGRLCEVEGLEHHDDGSVTLTLREWIEDSPDRG